MEVKAKVTTHTYKEWRARLTSHQRVMFARLEQRVTRDGDQAVLTDDQQLIVELAKILDEGGDVTEYIRSLADAE